MAPRHNLASSLLRHPRAVFHRQRAYGLAGAAKRAKVPALPSPIQDLKASADSTSIAPLALLADPQPSGVVGGAAERVHRADPLGPCGGEGRDR